jgi:hypothetical protein
MTSAKSLVVIAGVLAWFFVPLPGIAAAGVEPTAFELAKEGNRYVGEQAKDRIVQIRSEKSIGSTIPSVWYVVYSDPTATFKAVQVEFGGGKMISVKRPLRVLESVRGNKAPLDLSKLKIDSDKAIKTALSEPLLERVTVRATSAKLERGDGDLAVWKIRVWAAKLRHPNDQADLGEVILSAADGTMIKNALRIKRVD